MTLLVLLLAANLSQITSIWVEGDNPSATGVREILRGEEKVKHNCLTLATDPDKADAVLTITHTEKTVEKLEVIGRSPTGYQTILLPLATGNLTIGDTLVWDGAEVGRNQRPTAAAKPLMKKLVEACDCKSG